MENRKTEHRALRNTSTRSINVEITALRNAGLAVGVIMKDGRFRSVERVTRKRVSGKCSDHLYLQGLGWVSSEHAVSIDDIVSFMPKTIIIDDE